MQSPTTSPTDAELNELKASLEAATGNILSASDNDAALKAIDAMLVLLEAHTMCWIYPVFAGPRLITFCVERFTTFDENPQMHCAVAALLNFFVAAEKRVYNLGCVAVVHKLLASPIESVVAVGLRLCTVVVSDDTLLHTQLVDEGAVDTLVSVIERCLCLPGSASEGGGGAFHCLETLESAIWAVAAFCRSEPSPTIDVFSGVLPLLPLLLVHPSPTVQDRALWTVGFLLGTVTPTRFRTLLLDSQLDRNSNNGGPCILDLAHKLLSRATSNSITPLLRIFNSIAMMHSDLAHRQPQPHRAKRPAGR